ncbi:hypothetical protein ACFQ1S_39555, partial [Kibdelosporangium lantanae]
MRRILLPGVLALVTCGLLTSSSYAQPAPAGDPAVNAVRTGDTKEQAILAHQTRANQVVTVFSESPEATT